MARTTHPSRLQWAQDHPDLWAEGAAGTLKRESGADTMHDELVEAGDDPGGIRSVKIKARRLQKCLSKAAIWSNWLLLQRPRRAHLHLNGRLTISGSRAEPLGWRQRRPLVEVGPSRLESYVLCLGGLVYAMRCRALSYLPSFL